jgi:predicted transcriptional regulator
VTSRTDKADTPHHWISSPAQIRALASPARQEIVDALESAGASTAAELATLLGRHADALYFHLRKLVAVGLLRELEPRRDGRHVAAVYDVRRRPLRISYSDASPTQLAAVIASAMRLAIRDFSAAADGLPRPAKARPGRPPELWGARAKGWLDDAQIRRVNHLLAEVAKTVRTSRPRPGARPMTVSFVLAPAPRVQPDSQGPDA